MRILVSVLLTCVALSSAAFAQDGPAKLGQVHDELHLTPEQEGAWRDYAASIQPDPQVEARHKATEQLLPLLTAPRRIALIEATMTQDLADFRRRGDAVKALYGRLSPEQQQIFDRETARLAATESDGPGGAPPRP